MRSCSTVAACTAAVRSERLEVHSAQARWRLGLLSDAIVRPAATSKAFQEAGARGCTGAAKADDGAAAASLLTEVCCCCRVGGTSGGVLAEAWGDSAVRGVTGAATTGGTPLNVLPPPPVPQGGGVRAPTWLPHGLALPLPPPPAFRATVDRARRAAHVMLAAAPSAAVGVAGAAAGDAPAAGATGGVPAAPWGVRLRSMASAGDGACSSTDRRPLRLQSQHQVHLREQHTF
jgi:hypothetical protein